MRTPTSTNLPARAAAARSGAPGAHRVAATTADLVRWRSGALRDGTVARLLGHATPGDGAGRLLRYDTRSTAEPNGGTVLAPSDAGPRGRWHTLHDGTADLRWFGILGPEEPADDALDALVRDPSVSRIEAHTDLLFRRRHTYTRSHLELDLGGHTVDTDGIERNTHDNPFGALLYFRGRVTDTTQTRTLTETLPDLRDVFEVADSSTFAVGQWWALQSDARPGGGADERELQRLVEVTQVVDATHVRVNYKNGWELPAGRTLTWTRVEPVEHVRVRNMRFLGAGPFDGPENGELPDDRELTGSHPVAFEYAVRCDAEEIHGERTWWPVIMRRWNTHFVTRRCSVANPPTVFYGGAGYLTQQIYSLYGHVVDCRSHNARHLNDLTASAYCLVENCHGDGDDEGGNPFTTHGQYEHDLVFSGCSGLMDIANSGAQWGTSAKRITIRRHVASWFVVGTKITGLTLEDVHVVPRSTFDPRATMTINADGAHVRGCSAGFFAVGQRSSRSARPTVVEDCAFDLPAGSVLLQTPVTNPVHFVRTQFTGFDGTVLRGAGPVTFTDCEVVGATGEAIAAPASVGSADVTLRGGRWTGAGIALSGARDQRLTVSGSTMTGTTTAGALISRAGTDAAAEIHLRGADLTVPDGAAHVALGDGPSSYTATGTRLAGGRLDLGAAAPVVHAGCTFDRVDGVPQSGPTTVLHASVA